jgi:hypothetical protein
METTDDGHYVVIDGRRWRATDPQVPDGLREELVAELMAARRAVRADPDQARPRVADAKTALGERGEPWWAEPTDPGRRARVAATIRTLLRHRDAAATICPSDVARVVGGSSWHSVMDTAREVAASLHDDGVVAVLQRGQQVDPRLARGPMRIGRGPRWPT